MLQGHRYLEPPILGVQPFERQVSTHPKLASDHSLTSSRTCISNPLVIAREERRACSNNLPRRNATVTLARGMGQDYPPTGPSPGTNPTIYPSSLPRDSGNLFSDISPKIHGFFSTYVLINRVSPWYPMVREARQPLVCLQVGTQIPCLFTVRVLL